MKKDAVWVVCLILVFIIAAKSTAKYVDAGSASGMEIGSASDFGSGKLQPQRDEEIQRILELQAKLPYKELYNIENCEDEPDADCEGKTELQCLLDLDNMLNNCPWTCRFCAKKGGRTWRCENKRKECEDWEKTGDCQRLPDYMMQNCNRSCEFCGQDNGYSEADQHVVCPIWAQGGYCQTDYTIKALCPYSCSYSKYGSVQPASQSYPHPIPALHPYQYQPGHWPIPYSPQYSYHFYPPTGMSPYPVTYPYPYGTATTPQTSTPIPVTSPVQPQVTTPVTHPTTPSQGQTSVQVPTTVPSNQAGASTPEGSGVPTNQYPVGSGVSPNPYPEGSGTTTPGVSPSTQVVGQPPYPPSSGSSSTQYPAAAGSNTAASGVSTPTQVGGSVTYPTNSGGAAPVGNTVPPVSAPGPVAPPPAVPLPAVPAAVPPPAVPAADPPTYDKGHKERNKHAKRHRDEKHRTKELKKKKEN